MFQEIPNFLTHEECDLYIQLINKQNQPSCVSGSGNEISKRDDKSRTSSTSSFNNHMLLHKALNEKIAQTLQLDIKKGEGLQGQKYQVGQYFRPHLDWFQGDSYINHCLHSGNRTHTFMIYLNDNFEGGGTNFPKLNQIVKPERGKAVWWRNMDENKVGIQNVLHEGMDVIAGNKYIITSWWRENDFNGAEDAKKANEHHEAQKKTNTVSLVQSPPEIKTFKNINEIPRLTTNGFTKAKIPEDVWGLIQDAYSMLRDKEVVENFDNKKAVIETNIPNAESSTLLNFEHIPNIRKQIHSMLLPYHEEWANTKLEPSFIYGIRSYLKGATLIKHVDRIATHHISTILIVDKDLRCGCAHKELGEDWPLEIQGHDGKWYEVYAEPGEMILYESAVCEHGRTKPFEGKYYRNFYTHYKFVNYQYNA
tara:strand:- start:10963 stop:12228 length:1266 start_codon:yes stop_codon:yes gene_type:complete